jgi:hypothetical protein
MTDINSRRIQMAPVFLRIPCFLGHYLHLGFSSVDKVSENCLLILAANIFKTLSDISLLTFLSRLPSPS